MLIRKMLRDIWKNKVPFIAIFLMMFTANFIFSGITSEYNGLRENLNNFTEETNLANALVISEGFSEDEINEIKLSANIDNVEKRFFIPLNLDNDTEKTIDLFVLDEENSISKMKVIEGKTYNTKDDGIWLDISFARENDYEVGDKITFDNQGIKIEKEILGLGYSPEYIYNPKDGQLVADHKKNGFAFMNENSFPFKDYLIWNELIVVGSGDIETEINNILASKNFSYIAKEDSLSYSMINSEINQHKDIGNIFVVVFLIVALLVTVTTLHRLLNSQKLQIGILKAMGFKKKKLYFHYISHTTFVCLLGSFVGWVLGYLLLPELLLSMMREFYILPEINAEMLELSWLLPIICGVICLVISIYVCRKYLIERAANILYSNALEKEYKLLPFSKLMRKLSFYGQWNIRDIFRNRLRSIVTILGVVGCVAILYAALTMYASMNYMSEWTYSKAQSYEAKVSGNLIDEDYRNSLISDMNGESLMESYIEIRFDGESENGSFTGIESQEYIHLFNEKNKEITLSEGIALSKNIAEDLGIETGDIIEWKFLNEDSWRSDKVSFLVRSPISQGITMLKEDMVKENIDFVPTSIIGDKPSDSIIDSDYVNIVQYKDDLVAETNRLLESSIALIAIFILAALLLGSVILYNLGNLSYMERYREMATLKVLGFSNKKIEKLLVQQNIWLTIIGIILGLPAGYALCVYMFETTIQSSLDIVIYAPYYVYLITVIGTIGLSFLISKFLARKIRKVDMVAALKANE